METTAPLPQLPTARSLGHDAMLLLGARARVAVRWARAARRAHPRKRRCAALVLVISLTSLALAALVWDATVATRQGAASAQWTSDGRLEGSSLDTDVTHELERRRRDAPGQGRGDLVKSQSSGAAQAAGAAPSPVGGWLLSLGAVSSVLVAGAAAALAVVRRHRRPDDVEAAPLDPPAPWRLEAEDDETEAEHDPEVDGAADEPLDADAEQQRLPAPRPAHGDTPVALASQPGDGSPTSPGTALPLWDDSGVARQSLSTAATAVVVGEIEASRIEARQRVYERRAAPRVDYVHPGGMDWRGVHVELTVRDLSGTGLRLRVAPGHAAALPAANDYVQVDFPVDGGQVRVAAQIAWRRTTPDGIEMGVVFRPLGNQDLERIRETCLARL